MIFNNFYALGTENIPKVTKIYLYIKSLKILPAFRNINTGIKSGFPILKSKNTKNKF